jgi:hypothetical protein
LVASNYLDSATPRPGLPRDVTLETRKMRRSDFCNRLQTRAPHRLPDSRMRPSPGATLPRGSTARRRARAHLRPMASGAPPGEASLDGEPPASALSQPVSIVRGQVTPDTTMSVMRRGPGGASIECSSALHLPTAALSTARRARDVASDALCRDLASRSCLSAGPPRRSRQAPPPQPSRQRRAASPTPGRLPSTSALSPAGRLAPPGLAPSSGMLLAQPPRGAGSSTARHRTPGFAAASRLRSPFRRRSVHEARCREARPNASRGGYPSRWLAWTR